MELYQIQPPDVLVILQIPAEVLVIYEPEDEGERVLPGGINPDEWHENLVIVTEATACQRFLEQPLRVTFSKQNTLRYR